MFWIRFMLLKMNRDHISELNYNNIIIKLFSKFNELLDNLKYFLIKIFMIMAIRY